MIPRNRYIYIIESVPVLCVDLVLVNRSGKYLLTLLVEESKYFIGNGSEDHSIILSVVSAHLKALSSHEDLNTIWFTSPMYFWGFFGLKSPCK